MSNPASWIVAALATVSLGLTAAVAAPPSLDAPAPTPLNVPTPVGYYWDCFQTVSGQTLICRDSAHQPVASGYCNHLPAPLCGPTRR